MKLSVHPWFAEGRDQVTRSTKKDARLINSKMTTLKVDLDGVTHPLLLPRKRWDCKQPEGLSGIDVDLPLWQFDLGHYRGYMLIVGGEAVVFDVLRRAGDTTLSRSFKKVCARAHALRQVLEGG